MLSPSLQCRRATWLSFCLNIEVCVLHYLPMRLILFHSYEERSPVWTAIYSTYREVENPMLGHHCGLTLHKGCIGLDWRRMETDEWIVTRIVQRIVIAWRFLRSCPCTSSRCVIGSGVMRAPDFLAFRTRVYGAVLSRVTTPNSWLRNVWTYSPILQQ